MLKNAGNIAYKDKDYEKAIRQYTRAIEMSKVPHHTLFGNRASALLMLECFDECIMDCTRAIDIEPKFIKAYFRREKALGLRINEQIKRDKKIEADKEEEINKVAEDIDGDKLSQALNKTTQEFPE